MGGLQGAIHVVVTDGLFCLLWFIVSYTEQKLLFQDDKETRPPAHPYPLSPSEEQQQQFNLLGSRLSSFFVLILWPF